MLDSLFNSLRQRFETIRDERGTHANTATRIGEAFLALLSFLQTSFSGIFLRKDQDDETNFFITFWKGIKFGNFTSGALGTGGAVTVDENGNSSAEFDYLTVRKAATFRSITILELKHIGGELAITAGAMKVSLVEEQENAYRCYFDTTDGKRHVYQEFMVGDQARCQQFRLDPDPTEQGMLRTKYYWRLVTAVGEDWVELSKTDCDNGSGIPGVGDEVVQLGYRGNDHRERQSAIILSAVSSDAPSQKFYQGINSYNLVDKFVKEEGYDPTTGLFHCNIYGNFFVGDKGLSPTNYVKYTQNGLEISGVVRMNANSTLGGTNIQGILDMLGANILSASEAAAIAQAAADQAKAGLGNLSTGNENLIINGGFAGSYESESVESNTTVNQDTGIFSDPWGHWTTHNGCTPVTAAASATGLACQMSSGRLEQTIVRGIEAGKEYTFSVLGIAQGNIEINIGGITEQLALTANKRQHVTFSTLSTVAKLTITGSATFTELQLIRGNIVLNDWVPSPFDNNKYLSYYKNLAYLMDAIEQGSTTTIGGLVLTSQIRVGNYANRQMVQETGGMNGDAPNDNAPFLWGGGTMAQAIETITMYANDPTFQPTAAQVAQMAKFVVTHGGRAILNDIILRGYVYALGGVFKGSLEIGDDLDKFIVDSATGELTMRGPSATQDLPGHPVDPQSTLIDLLKVTYQSDPDTFARIAKLILNCSLGTVTIDAEYGLQTQKSNSMSIVHPEFIRTRKTNYDAFAELSNGELILSIKDYSSDPNNGTLCQLRINGLAEIYYSEGGTAQWGGRLTVDSNGNLKLVNV